MKIWASMVAGAALIIAVADYCLYSLPEHVRPLHWNWVSVPPSARNANVYVMVRNCGQYARQTGYWWWKRSRVDYRACADDDATAGEVKVIGELMQSGSSPPVRIRFTFACVSCKTGRLLTSVTIPLGATPDKGTSTLKLPSDLRLNQEDELQLLYAPKTDAETPLITGVPYVE